MIDTKQGRIALIALQTRRDEKRARGTMEKNNTIADRLALTRRTLITANVGTGLVMTTAGLARAASDDEGVTAPEDLMKEHGVLNRCLLIYEEAIRRIEAKEELRPDVFQHTANLVRRFVEEYHEKNEETYIFPVFKKAGKLADLVDTLLTQHKAGRAVTGRILTLAQPETFRSAANRQQIVETCQSFIRMYRPHEAREDTVLFPALRTILKPKEVGS